MIQPERYKLTAAEKAHLHRDAMVQSELAKALNALDPESCAQLVDAMNSNNISALKELMRKSKFRDN
jgi:hypothetical protein